MPRSIKHRARRLHAAFCDSVWAIADDKFAAMRELLDLRASGLAFTPEEVRARLGMQSGDDDDESVSRGPRTVNGVAVLPLHGILAPRMNMFTQISGGTSLEQFSGWLATAVADPNVHAIVIDVNSPGGAAKGNEELAAQIRAARGQKPIIAVITELGASAAYYVASAADEIVVSPSAEVGSIGTMQIHAEYSKQNAMRGVTATVFRGGVNKNAANDIEPLNDAGRRAMQARVDDYYRQFITAVATNRGITPSEVEERYGQGATFIASRAVAVGLADRIGTLADVVMELQTRSQASERRGRRGTQEVGVRSLTPASPHRQPLAAIKPTRHDTPPTTFCAMPPEVFQALVARKLIAADATEDAAQAALTAYYAGRQQAMPNDAAAIVGDLAPTAPPPGGGVEASEIMALVKIANLGADVDRLTFATELIEARDGAGQPLSMGEIVKRIHQRVVAAAPQPGAAPPVRTTADERDKFYNAAHDALLLRRWGGRWPTAEERAAINAVDDHAPPLRERPADGARQDLRLQSLPRLCEELAAVCGVDRRRLGSMGRMDLANFVLNGGFEGYGPSGTIMASDAPAYNVSGMFQHLMLDAAHMTMRRGYSTVSVTYDRWMRRGESAMDFKDVNRILRGEFSDPKAVPEDGEFEETTTQDDRVRYAITIWGQIFSLTLQMIVNDSLGAFLDIAETQGRAMKRKQNRLAYQVLKDNPSMQDGTALFHASHTNLTTGAATPTVATMNTMQQKMREQKGKVGSDNADASALNIPARYLIVPTALEGTALELVASIANPANANANVVNIWNNRLLPIIEGELAAAFGGSDTAFYLAADSGDLDTIEYMFLQGVETPRVEQIDAFTRLARKFRIWQGFAVKAIDWRGLQKHNGV